MSNYTEHGTALNHFTTTTANCHNESVYESADVRLAQQIAIVHEIRSDSRPFMVMDLDRVNVALDAWHQHLPEVKPFFSVQCNSDPVLLESLARFPGMGFNCTTRNDVRLSLEVVPSGRLLYSNPCITNSTLREANESHVDLLAFESLGDLNRIALHHPGAELILNIGSDASVDGDEEALDRAEELLQLAADMKCYCVGIGLSSFDDEYRLDPAAYPKALENCRRLLEFGKRMGLPLRLINLGDVGSSQSLAAFSRVANEIDTAVRTNFPRELFPDLCVIATPSRFFCEEAFSLVTRITGRQLVGADMVTNDEFDSNSEAYLYEISEGVDRAFGCANSGRGCRPLFPRTDSGECLSAVVGPSLDGEWDFLQAECGLPLLHTGDWLIWPRMGAYSLNNVDGVDMGDEGPPSSVFYLAPLGISGAAYDAYSSATRLYVDKGSHCHGQQKPTLVYGAYDDGRGSSLGSDYGTGSEECEESAIAESSDAIVPSTESKVGNDQWVLDWLFNEFNQ